ncbi:MAG: DUF222 domain-containing protein, partial [Lacisediminihabitans sp.]
MQNLAQSLRTSADAVAGLGASAADIASLGDTALLTAQELISTHRRHLDTFAAWVAGEIARRSRHELGYAGLAQRTGFVSPEALIQSVSKTTRAEAAKFVQVGTMMAESEASDAFLAQSAGDGRDDAPAAISAGAPWQAQIVRAVTAGNLSVDAAESISKGLGVVDEAIGGEQLRLAAERLLVEANSLGADPLFRRARQLRDELDADGISRREKERRDQRYLKVYQRRDGMYGGSFLLDPENGRLFASTIDELMSPRRGGPRFVDPDEKAIAETLLGDERTNDQIA